MATTEPPSKDDGDFFDDDNNKAMFLVLPAIILVYGGCALIYCVHKCRRFFINRKKKKMKAEKRRMQDAEKQAYTNPVAQTSETSVVLIDKQNFNSDPGTSSQDSRECTALTLECLDTNYYPKTRPKSSNIQETDVDSLPDVLQKESMAAIAPGYQETSRNMSEEMQHLDNQLKVAFRLARQDEGKETLQETSSKPYVRPYSGSETAKTVVKNDGTVQVISRACQTDSSMTNVNTDEQREVIPKKKKKTQKVGDRQALLMNPEIPMEDFQSISAVRSKILKEMPKSMPDVSKNPDENTMTLKKITLKGGAKRIFLSSQ